MRPIPSNHRRVIDSDPFYRKCVRFKEGTCSGRITIEHAIIYASRQISELWNYVPLCEYHHSIGIHMEDGDLKKDYGQYIAISRMTEKDMLKYPKRNWKKDLEILEKKFII